MRSLSCISFHPFYPISHSNQPVVAVLVARLTYSRRPRLSHRVCAMHDCGICLVLLQMGILEIQVFGVGKVSIGFAVGGVLLAFCLLCYGEGW